MQVLRHSQNPSAAYRCQEQAAFGCFPPRRKRERKSPRDAPAVTLKRSGIWIAKNIQNRLTPRFFNVLWHIRNTVQPYFKRLSQILIHTFFMQLSSTQFMAMSFISIDFKRLVSWSRSSEIHAQPETVSDWNASTLHWLIKKQISCFSICLAILNRYLPWHCFNVETLN